MKKKSVYDSVTNEKRVKLIHMVNNGEKLNKSASVLNINYSTAKTILRIYRNERRIFKKVPVKSIFTKKKVFAIERASCSTHNSCSEDKVDFGKKVSESVNFKMPKSAFKRVGGNNEIPLKLDEMNYYLNLRQSFLAEISKNQKTLNYLTSMLTYAKVASN